MAYIQYAEVNSLDEISMIAGNDFTMTFTVYQDDGVTLQDIGGATIKWMLAPYGQSDYNVLQYNGNIITANSFTISLLGADTINLSGKYIQQLKINSFYGQVYRPAQGVVLFIPATPTT
jgi:hypothetical protein